MFFIRYFKKMPPGRLIALGFALVILAGALILKLPVSVWPDAEVSFVDALFTSTSAVCVTGLIAIDVADHFTPFGQAVVAVLIQIGGGRVRAPGVGCYLGGGPRGWGPGARCHLRGRGPEPGGRQARRNPWTDARERGAERGQFQRDHPSGARCPSHDPVL